MISAEDLPGVEVLLFPQEVLVEVDVERQDPTFPLEVYDIVAVGRCPSQVGFKVSTPYLVADWPVDSGFALLREDVSALY